MTRALALSLIMLTACAPAYAHQTPRVDLHECRVVDGDGVKCQGVSIRLQAIQAPDSPDSSPCRQGLAGYVCNQALFEASKEHMRQLIAGQRLTFEQTGTDRFSRPVGHVYANGQNLACLMMASGHATYWARYDRDGRIMRECGV